MRNIKLSAFVLLLLFCGAVAAQTAGAPNVMISTRDGRTSIETVPSRVRLTYQDHELTELKLYLSVRAIVTSRARPAGVTFYFRNMSAPNVTMAHDSRLLWFVCDGEQVILGRMKLDDWRSVGGIDGVTELLDVTASYESFLKIATGKEVTGRLGEMSFELSDAQRRILLALTKTDVF
jgi:hypothetical protein